MFGELPALERELAQASSVAVDDVADGSPMVIEEVGPDDVADVVSDWTGIPADRLLEDEADELHAQAQAESAPTTSEQTMIAGHAFMSYVRENSAEADRLQQVLEAAGVRVWRDSADLGPGQDWREKIGHAILDDSLVFLCVFLQEKRRPRD
jgi:hypothetical protein